MGVWFNAGLMFTNSTANVF